MHLILSIVNDVSFLRLIYLYSGNFQMIFNLFATAASFFNHSNEETFLNSFKSVIKLGLSGGSEVKARLHAETRFDP